MLLCKVTKSDHHCGCHELGYKFLDVQYFNKQPQYEVVDTKIKQEGQPVAEKLDMPPEVAF